MIKTRAYLPLFIATAVLVSGCAITITEENFFTESRDKWQAAQFDTSYVTEEFSVRHADGNVSHGIHLFSPKTKATVLFFAGDNEVIDREGAVRLWQFRKLGVNAFIFDRRGSGLTPGKATAALLSSDALEIFDKVRSHSKGTIIVHGFSLGSMLAGMLASNRSVDALILEGSAPNIQEFAMVRIPWYAAPFVRLEIAPELRRADNAAVVSNFRGPLMIAVGANDIDTPPFLSEKLFGLAASPEKRLEVVPRAGHHALTTPAGLVAYRAFISSVVPGSS